MHNQLLIKYNSLLYKINTTQEGDDQVDQSKLGG